MEQLNTDTHKLVTQKSTGDLYCVTKEDYDNQKKIPTGTMLTLRKVFERGKSRYYFEDDIAEEHISVDDIDFPL